MIKNAKVLGETLSEKGIKLVSGGTDNHLLLIDLSGREITGKDAEIALGHAGITVNKNTVPNEKRSPFVTSGIRVGTPALTTRGMKEEQMKIIGDWIASVIDNASNEDKLREIKTDVENLCKDFPLY